jgi:hypothetical protein
VRPALLRREEAVDQEEAVTRNELLLHERTSVGNPEKPRTAGRW